MKKSLSALAALLLLFMAVIILPSASSAEDPMVEVTRGATIRSGPSNKSSKRGPAKEGSRYPYIGTEGSWYAFQVDNNTIGYLPKSSCRLLNASDVPVGNVQGGSFAGMIRALKDPGRLETNLPGSFRGKTAIAVYYDLNGKPEELSTDKLSKEGSYWSVPVDLLAEKMSDADWAFLVWPVFEGSGDEQELYVSICAMDMKNNVCYAPYKLDDRVTLLENDESSYELDPTLRGIEMFILREKWESANLLANDADYQEGLKLFKAQKFYSAYQAFRRSNLDEAEAQAEKCIQKWPRNGEIWRNPAVTATKTELTVSVNQDSDEAMLIKLMKGTSTVTCQFIGGTGKVTVQLPAGNYTIKEGAGRTWYGMEEAFGRDGSYKTMTFGKNDAEVVTLKSGHAYTITVNVTNPDPKAQGIGSKYESWDDF